MAEPPFVSIIVPILNEANYIEVCLNSILDNTYPSDMMEVLVVDGGSNDGTIEIVERIIAENSNVRIINNPARIQTVAMNLGIKSMKGDVFIRIDGHATVPNDFVEKSTKCLLDNPDAWIVGGYWKTESTGLIGKAISAATETPLGVGNARHRLGNYNGYVDTVSYGAHHKWVIDKIGLFDESLARNEDDDFNYRVHRAGGKIWMSSEIWSTYYARSSLLQLWQQYYQYGFWRIRTIQKHKKPAVFRQLVPLLFVSSILGLALLGFIHTMFWYALLVEATVYSFGLLYGGVSVLKKTNFAGFCIAPLIFFILHAAYGIGSLWGIVRWLVFRGVGMPKPEDCKLTR